jgi:SNF2 family DNA or RNA helicase
MSSLTQGAVLADDMGLGKTIQALALLLHRAECGRALVVAPASVVSAWSDALTTFAPSLIGLVELTTWSMLARESETFAQRQFATVVLDEAQSLKNADTQRARAAFGLGAQFVLALTGTPLENHLGEVWSLFHATVPALLGSEDHFRSAYLGAEPASIAALAAVIKPFMLRRTKASVAPELPPKTERTMRIELSPQERAFTEAIRREAVASASTNAFAALAALTRLRLAASHPRLVDPGWSGPTSKLSALRALVATLRDEGHRVLIFSQFTKHLALVRDALTADGVT